jgi:hypothetical protein
MKHNIKNSSRFLSHEIHKLVQWKKKSQTINTKVFNNKTKSQITKLIWVKKVIQPYESNLVTFLFW